MFKYIIWSLAAVLLIVANGASEKILAIFPFPSTSHFISFTPLLEQLANRGHQMTVVSAFPRKSPLKNYKDITIKNFLENFYEEEGDMFEMKDVNLLWLMVDFRWTSVEWCDNFLHESGVQDLIHSTDDRYDLIIYEPFFTECAYGLMHKFNVPFIQIISNTINEYLGDGVGNPQFYSYIPNMELGYSDHMSFTERMYNSLFQIIFDVERKWVTLPRMEAVIQKHFNDHTFPGILEVETNASFLLMNSHPSLNYPRPLTPNTVEVGGMHVKEPKRLPQDLQKLLDEAKDGVIYFSLGTNVRSSHLPETIRNAILKSFSKIKQKVLWKWEAETLPGQPKNVHVNKWYPQNDILAHPNVKAFITHGGLLSTQEATYHGVPLIAIPIMADQLQNSRKAEEKGYAIVINTNNITEKALDWALQEILTNDKYRENAKHLSNLFRDQPLKPLDAAVFWTEYVIRHKGARHMRSAGLKLNFFQYYLLDVIVVVVLAVIIAAKLSFIVCKSLFRRLFSKSMHSKHKKTN